MALITGASRGIGRATAELFAAEGAKVCVNYVRGESEANQVVKAIESSDGHAFAYRCDVSKESEVAAMVDEVVARYGKLDVLVNNAGILRVGDLFSVTDADLDEMIGVNVKGTIYCTRQSAKRMLERDEGGKIVNVASNSGLGTSYKGTTAYGLTKAAVMLLTKRFAFEFRGRNINVNCVAPGYTETEMPARGKTRSEFEAAIKDVSSRAILNRVGQPAEIARAILFLASDDSSFATGQTIMVDGGRMDYLSHAF